MKLLRLSPHAEADVAAAARWYEGEYAGLGDQFVASTQDALHFIATNPGMYQISFDDVRRVLVHRFPYAIFYRITDQYIEVIGILHHRVDPVTVECRA